MATIKKTTIKKAKDGMQTQPKPKSKDTVNGIEYGSSFRQGVANKRMAEGNRPEGGYGASKEDSAQYRFGYGRGLRGEKEYPGEQPVQKMGRWKGQNAAKAAVPKKKNGGALKPVDPSKKKSLGKLPTAVRNKMGFKKDGGTMKAKSGTSMKKCKYGC